jgi:hypothetical protein
VIKQPKITLVLPENYEDMNADNRIKFTFDYLQEIKFPRDTFDKYISLSPEKWILFKPFVETLSYVNDSLNFQEIAGGLFMLHKCFLEEFTYQQLCEAVVENSGGFRLTYSKRRNKKINDEKKLRDEIYRWAEIVIEEPENEFDPEVRYHEYLDFQEKLKKLRTKATPRGRLYQTTFMPSSPLQKILKNVNERIKNAL